MDPLQKLKLLTYTPNHKFSFQNQNYEYVNGIYFK